MTRTILDIHVLQTVPPSNLNRDDTGQPKTATYGGVRRARVSSQAWKRATRRAFDELLDPSELGVRSKKLADELADRITAAHPSIERTAAWGIAAETLQTATGSKIEVPRRKKKDAEEEATETAPESSYLMFLSRRQLDGLAALAVEGTKGTDDLNALKAFLKAKENKARARALVDTRHSVDIALFGRMVADATDLNVEASTQVAHALSVHAVDNESDYYTAVDDKNTEAEKGAGMIGTVEFNSATLYRYAALDVDRLRDNLGVGLRDDESPDEPTRRAVEAFVEGFIASLPTGKINTFGNHTLPDAVIVKLRTKRPVSYVAAFEKPVAKHREEGGFLRASCERLAAYAPDLEERYGLTDEGSWVLRIGSDTVALADLGTEMNSKDLIEAVGAAVTERLSSGAA
ncbi:type I-E CRISPR-associated protein Cas7/Cse4/CasC [Streptomyces marincola]|uniref:Type I-E CRISPR-associated protein Cas7/Cse4/CasC n=1 Tax=Streptomyces marincola TaxID=2878388 RepID=A0A1W7CWX7_9ACTN|nr:type I-E CRISPR-associated protein Cas7/Cse4/CasC [Streptomyces marincola]ARQ69207.1 type I-E CRISPR-associated protein Cas7/Cse4/CasC [Streptomyces marincola]